MVAVPDKVAVRTAALSRLTVALLLGTGDW